jgi:hypothetical protein
MSLLLKEAARSAGHQSSDPGSSTGPMSLFPRFRPSSRRRQPPLPAAGIPDPRICALFPILLLVPSPRTQC